MTQWKLMVDSDATGSALLMALAARPPKLLDDSKFRRALQVINDVAGWGHFAQTGVEHPLAPRRGKRSYADRQASLFRLFTDLDDAVRAGKAFRSSLKAKAIGVSTAAAVRLSFEDDIDGFSFSMPVRNHQLWIDEQFAAAPDREKSNVRQSIWDRWLPAVHVAGAFSILLDSNKEMHGGLPHRDKLYWSLLFNPQNRDVAPHLCGWANQLADEAKRVAFFSKDRLVKVEASGTSAFLP